MVEKTLRARQALAASQNQKMIRDVQEALASEKAKRVAAEKKVAGLSDHLHGISKIGKDPLQLKADLERLQTENTKLKSASSQAQKEIDRLRDHVDEAEAARKAKTEELATKLHAIEDVKQQEKLDLAALQLSSTRTTRK